jgi:DNA gyrase subunit A
LGRATQGVTLINLGEGEKLSGLEKVVETDDDEETGAEVAVKSAPVDLLSVDENDDHQADDGEEAADEADTE